MSRYGTIEDLIVTRWASQVPELEGVTVLSDPNQLSEINKFPHGVVALGRQVTNNAETIAGAVRITANVLITFGILVKSKAKTPGKSRMEALGIYDLADATRHAFMNHYLPIPKQSADEYAGVEATWPIYFDSEDVELIDETTAAIELHAVLKIQYH